MSDSSTIEVSAPDIETAIAKGVAELGVSRDDVIVEVLEEPARRLLGLGTKQAKVRLTVIGMRPKAVPPVNTPVAVPLETVTVPETSIAQATQQETLASEVVNRPAPGTATHSKARPGRGGKKPPIQEDPEEDYPELFDEEDDLQPTLASEEELATEAKIGAETLRELLQHMHIEAKVSARAAETDEDEPPHWTLEIQGRDLGGLIGRRGETLTALQYITRLIASKGLERRANLVIDVEGYKSRRETMLKRLAKRMADQAVQRGRTVQLEPMPPHERRIIHLTLRDHPEVRTESVGDGEHRKVTIVPKKAK